ncbi:hypothetical protein BpHYR1_032312 [Brachionus plicatilis]|uniref:Uncharacterized protein n=1 Tax=Brachionus plicatilis TaxID=10195 RepID=A0A3M7RBT5_BRAPC|nr:hypothetical protein BpHYR1_032312 [Brachionus plicatilis]
MTKLLTDQLCYLDIETNTTTKRNLWIISFKNTFNHNQLTGKQIQINQKEYTIESAKESEKTKKVFTYKFIILRPNFHKRLIADHLISKGIGQNEIKDLYDEYCQ